jgi:hypothetical protein
VTVAELVSRLQAMPPDAVVVFDADDFVDEVTDVRELPTVRCKYSCESGDQFVNGETAEQVAKRLEEAILPFRRHLWRFELKPTDITAVWLNWKGPTLR